MAKSLRSKIQRRWRTLKRGHLDNIVGKKQHEKIVQTLNAVLVGQQYRQKQPKNAFLHPNDSDSKFPQIKPAPMIDLRSNVIPGSGREWSGGNRKQKMITKEFKGFDKIEEESVQGSQQVNVIREEKMNIERPTQGQNANKAKKNRKSKLRKTIVF